MTTKTRRLKLALVAVMAHYSFGFLAEQGHSKTNELVMPGLDREIAALRMKA